jgi:hypothetical protein
VGQRLRTAAEILNPDFLGAGFAPAQYGGPPLEPSGVIYCASFDEFAARHSGLPQANEQKRGVGACVDLLIEVDGDDRLTEVRLEGHSLYETCRSTDRTQEAEAAATIVGSDVIDALDTMRPILRSLLAEAED